MTPHATPEYLTGYLASGTTVAEPERVLARATEVIDRHVRQPYTLGDDGLASDEDTAVALRLATCAQVEFWCEVGEEHDVVGLTGQVSVIGLTTPLPDALAPRARRILETAGLTKPNQHAGVVE